MGKIRHMYRSVPGMIGVRRSTLNDYGMRCHKYPTLRTYTVGRLLMYFERIMCMDIITRCARHLLRSIKIYA